MRVAVVGVGNCASALIQGVHYYRDAKPGEFVPGLMHVDLGGYHISDIEFSAAFDVDADKVGRDLGEAIGRGQNNTVRFCEVPEMGVPVQRGMTHDGIGKYLSTVIKKSPGRDRRRRRRCSRTRAPTSSSRTCPWARSRPPSGTSSRCCRPGARS